MDETNQQQIVASKIIILINEESKCFCVEVMKKYTKDLTKIIKTRNKTKQKQSLTRIRVSNADDSFVSFFFFFDEKKTKFVYYIVVE